MQFRRYVRSSAPLNYTVAHRFPIGFYPVGIFVLEKDSQQAQKTTLTMQ